MKYDYFLAEYTVQPTNVVLSNFEYTLDKFPTTLLNYLHACGIRISFGTLEQLKTWYGITLDSGAGKYLGKISNEYVVFINTRAITTIDINVIPHEIMHGYTMEFITPEYNLNEAKAQEIYTLEKNLLKFLDSGNTSYYRSNIVEFFAEGISQYIMLRSNSNDISTYYGAAPNFLAFCKDVIDVQLPLHVQLLNFERRNGIADISTTNAGKSLLITRKDNSKTIINFPESSGGGEVTPPPTTESEFVFDNTKNFSNVVSNFRDKKITYSYFNEQRRLEGMSYNVDGVWRLITDCKVNTSQGPVAFQERVYLAGEPDIPPQNRECRYWESNVINGWTPWVAL